MQLFDLFIIGGGINGSAIARDAAGRGLSVFLCEMNDLASGTSSKSSKLIHGGLRYLESYEFKLVHEALKEREVLMRSAPFLIHPLKFILPYEKHLRSPWLLRAGLFLYDHLSKRTQIPGSKRILFNPTDVNNPLKDAFRFGFSYYDCQTNDARLTILNAVDAHLHGAEIHTYTQCTSVIPQENTWLVTLRDTTKGTEKTIQARAVVNATGPWVSITNKTVAQLSTQSQVQLVQGSHVIVPKLYSGTHAYILQNKDQRIVFAMPYCNQFTLIGTTDTPFVGDPSHVVTTTEEINYLCDIMNHYFKKAITPADIVASYSGVRSLYDNNKDHPSQTTRDYHLELNSTTALPYISIFGGKITTSRLLAEATMSLLSPYFETLKPAWTAQAYLPGGNLGGLHWSDFLSDLDTRYPWLPHALRVRYANAYGSRIHLLLKGAQQLSDLGKEYKPTLYERELHYWQEHEFASCPEDMLQRRSDFWLLT